MRKFNIYDFCEKKSAKKNALNGVYHDNGMLVATDAFVLAAIQSPENDPMNGKIIDKNGSEIPGNYPRWRGLVPAIEKCEEVEYNTEEIKEFLAAAKAEKKANKRTLVIRIGSGHFSAEVLDRFNKFVLTYPDSKVYTRLKDGMVMMAVSGENVCCAMCHYYGSDDDKTKLYNIVIREKRAQEEQHTGTYRYFLRYGYDASYRN